LPVDASDDELAFWRELWRKPQAVQWAAFGVEAQVAMYARTFLEAARPGASGNLKTSARQLDNELGVSIGAMLALGWRITDGSASSESSESKPAARRTSSGDWLKAVSVE